MQSPAVPLSALTAPKHWTAIDFISDLHLQRSDQLTFQAWRDYMARTTANAIFILGDLFEVWVGDDVLSQSPTEPATSRQHHFEALCAQILLNASLQHDVFFMHGNRDFLFLDEAAKTCGLRRLNDPCRLTFGQQHILLSHGDSLCLADTDYMAFRAEVRSDAWQEAFLGKPLAQRMQIAVELRAHSEARKKNETSASYADVNHDLALQWLTDANSRHLIHGHTHKPADHKLGPGLIRHVLSDWDAGAVPCRAEVLRLTLDACSDDVNAQRLPVSSLG